MDMRQQTAETLRLQALLDQFRERYSGLSVDPTPMDLTDCYWSQEAGRYIAPRSYGILPEQRVMGYVAFGGAFISKFSKDSAGHVIREDGMPVIAGFSMEQEVMACLCVHDLRNTSLFEISDALAGTHKIQGYRRWHLRKLAEGIQSWHPAFCVQDDSCFLFAGDAADIEPRIALNAAWLGAVVARGGGCLDTMSQREADLMARVFPEAVLAGDPEVIRMRSYMWSRVLWQPLSAAFLGRKVAARLAYLRSGRARGHDGIRPEP